MYAVLVREIVESDHIEASKAPLDQVLRQVRQAPGIVSALFSITDEGRTLNVLVFESEGAARGALDRVSAAPRPDFVRLESAEVAEVLASF
jgi:hypothetical protein